MDLIDQEYLRLIHEMAKILPENESFASLLSHLPLEERKELLEPFSPALLKQLQELPEFYARKKQLYPLGTWQHWLILSGRGWGKNWVASNQFIKKRVQNGAKQIHIVTRTAADYRDTVIDGPSGIIAAYHHSDPPIYEPSKRSLTWSNGTKALCFSAEKPDQLRGVQCDTYLADELASWRALEETWDNLLMGHRVGSDPRGIITTTPRPLAFLRDLLEADNVHVTRGHTLENQRNLPDAFMKQMVEKYEGTSRGRQELAGEILGEAEGALWTREILEQSIMPTLPFPVRDLNRIVVAIDPSASTGGNEAGIMIAGERNGRGYLLEDRSIRGSPKTWAQAAVSAYYDYGANMIIAEKNNGGEMVSFTIEAIDPNVPVKLVTASRGKRTRAEPVVAKYEQGKIKHIGDFNILEDQMCNWIPGEGVSPDRVDAAVWAFTWLLVGQTDIEGFIPSTAGRRVSKWKK